MRGPARGLPAARDLGRRRRLRGRHRRGGAGGGGRGGQPRPAARQGRQRHRRGRGGAERRAGRRTSSCSATATSAPRRRAWRRWSRRCERGECDLAVAAFSRRVGGGFGLALGFARWAIRRLCGARDRGADLRPAGDAGRGPARGAALRRRLRDGDRDDRRRRPRRLPAAASTSSTSSTARPAGTSPASSTGRGSCATSPAFTCRAGREPRARKVRVMRAEEKRLAALAVLVAALRLRRRAGQRRAGRARQPLRQVRRRHRADRRCRGTPTRRSRSGSTAPSGPSRANGRRRCASSRSRSTAAAGSKPRGCRSAGAARSRRRARRRRWQACGDGAGRHAAATSPASPSPNRTPSRCRGRSSPSTRSIDGERAILAHVYGAQPVPEQPHLRLPHPQVAAAPSGPSSPPPCPPRSTATAT